MRISDVVEVRPGAKIGIQNARPHPERARAAHQRRMARVPEWANSDTEVRALLLRSFPKLKTDLAQKKRAALWSKVIFLYWRELWGGVDIAKEMKIPASMVYETIKRIKRAGAGLRTDGKPRTRKPKGFRL